MINSITLLEMIVRLVIAVVAGAAIGWEREQRDKPAGLRTHMLVSLGAAAFMVIALEYCDELLRSDSAIRLDPLRVASAVIGGVGFLGAGTIIQARGSVKGITTAASIWVAAAIGTACGMGYSAIAVTCVLLAIVTLALVGLFEKRVLES